MAFKISVDGTRTEIKGTGEQDALLWDQIKEAIGGGYVQMVACDPVVCDGNDVYFCDEEGKMKGFLPNAEATKLSTYTMPGDVLAGDILFARQGKGEDLF